MKYLNMKPAKTNSPSVDVDTLDGGYIDFYNCCELLRVVLDPGGLTFEFSQVYKEGASAALRFGVVTDLTMCQTVDWDAREFPDFQDYMIRPEGPWRNTVVKAGGFEYEFNCQEVELVL